MKIFRVCLITVFLFATIFAGGTAAADGAKAINLTIIHNAMENPPNEHAYELSFKLYKDNADPDDEDIEDWYDFDDYFIDSDMLNNPALELINEFTYSKTNTQTTIEGLDPGYYILAFIPPPGYDLNGLSIESGTGDDRKTQPKNADPLSMEIIPFELSAENGDTVITAYTGLSWYDFGVDVQKNIMSVNGSPLAEGDITELPNFAIGDEIMYEIKVTNTNDSDIKVPFIFDLYSNGLDFPGGDPVNVGWKMEIMPPLAFLHYDGLQNDPIPPGGSRIVELKLAVIGIPFESPFVNAAFVPSWRAGLKTTLFSVIWG